MRKKVKFMYLVFLALLPASRVKNSLYNILKGYRVSKDSRISIFTFINCENLMLDNAEISFLSYIEGRTIILMKHSKVYRFVTIKGVNKLLLGETSILGVGTKVITRHCDRLYSREYGNFIIGESCVITNNNYFDVLDNIELKDNVVIGGGFSKFFTHGFDVNNNRVQGSISIGNNCYFGTSCIVQPGVKVCDYVVFTPGTVIYKDVHESGTYSSSEIKRISSESSFNKNNKYLIGDDPRYWRKNDED